MTSPAMSRRTQAVIALLVVFACGAFAGYMYPRTPVRRIRAVVLRPGVEQFDQLGLNESQRKRIDDILASAQPHTDSLMKAVLPALRTFVDSVDMVIRRELTPQQQLQLDSLRAKTQRER